MVANTVDVVVKDVKAGVDVVVTNWSLSRTRSTSSSWSLKRVQAFSCTRSTSLSWSLKRTQVSNIISRGGGE